MEFHASVYMYTKSPSYDGYRVKDETIGVSEFSNHQYGISLSGPIIKNKLFFFINGEMDRQEEPIFFIRPLIPRRMRQSCRVYLIS